MSILLKTIQQVKGRAEILIQASLMTKSVLTWKLFLLGWVFLPPQLLSTW